MTKVNPDALSAEPNLHFCNSHFANPLSAELFDVPLSRMFARSHRRYG